MIESQASEFSRKQGACQACSRIYLPNYPVSCWFSSVLFSGDSFAEALQVSTRTLDQWRYTHKGPRSIVVGRHRRYLAEDLRAWLDEQGEAEAAAG